MLGIVVLSLLPSFAFSVVCSKSAPLNYKTSHIKDRKTGKLTTQTLVSISLGLKETVCFTLHREGESEVVTYGISFDKVNSILEYKNSYVFSTPRTEVKCICDCPGAEDFCGSNTDVCRENYVDNPASRDDVTCYNWFREGASNTGCTAFLSGSAEVCCSLALHPSNTTRWRAVELGNGVNRAIFSVVNLSSRGGLGKRTTEIDIESGHQITDPFDVTVSAPAISSPIRNGWYFGEDGGAAMWGGVEVNTLSEYDLNKVGWYKMEHGQYYMNKDAILSSFNVEVKNCDRDDLHVTFNSKYSDRTFVEAVELTELYKATVASVSKDDSARKVKVVFRHYSNVEMTLALDANFSVTQVFDFSHFDDFEAEVLMDKHSNHFLNITIKNGEGTLRGNLSAGGTSEIFKINLAGEQQHETVVYKRISTFCEKGTRAMMCLWTDTNRKRVICKDISCSEEPLKKFELPGSEVEYEKGEKMSILSLATWAKHLNPLEWFNGITNWKEGLIMMTELVGIVTLIGIAIKIFRAVGCLGRCWMCVFCHKNDDTKKDEEDEEKKGNEKPSVFRRMCFWEKKGSSVIPYQAHEYDTRSRTRNQRQEMDNTWQDLNDMARSPSLQLDLQDLMEHTDGVSGRYIRPSRSCSSTLQGRESEGTGPSRSVSPLRDLHDSRTTFRYLEEISRSVQDMADSLQHYQVEQQTSVKGSFHTLLGSSPNLTSPKSSRLAGAGSSGVMTSSPCHVTSTPQRLPLRKYSLQASPPQLLSRSIRGLDEPGQLEEKLRRIQKDLMRYQKDLGQSKQSLV